MCDLHFWEDIAPDIVFRHHRHDHSFHMVQSSGRKGKLRIAKIENIEVSEFELNRHHKNLKRIESKKKHIVLVWLYFEAEDSDRVVCHSAGLTFLKPINWRDAQCRRVDRNLPNELRDRGASLPMSVLCGRSI